MPDEVSSHPEAPRSFTRRVWTVALILLAVAGGVLLLWLAVEVALLFFASVLLGIFLRTIADWIGRRTHLGRGWSLGVTCVGLLLLAALASWLLAAPISRQVDHLSRELPEAVQRMEEQLSQYSWGKRVVERLQNPGGLLAQTGGIMEKVRAVFSVSIKGVIWAWVILFCGFYLALHPEVYMEGFLRLVPVNKRARARDVLLQAKMQLQRWIFGQIVAMTIIGVLTYIGLRLLGITAAEVLGVLAGVLDFVPVVGPWIAGIVSTFIALLKSPMHAVYVICLFSGLHLLEGHLLIPLVQREATRLPPVLTVLAMVLFSRLFGFLGLFLATPLLALVIILTRTLYVEDVVER